MDPIALLLSRKTGSLRALAREIPCSAPYLSDIFKGRRQPGPKILSYLGIEKQSHYNYQKIKRKRKNGAKRC